VQDLASSRVPRVGNALLEQAKHLFLPRAVLGHALKGAPGDGEPREEEQPHLCIALSRLQPLSRERNARELCF
jgi:hypothetical protein